MAYHTNDKITDGLSRLDKIFAEAEKFSKAPPTKFVPRKSLAKTTRRLAWKN